MTDIKHECDICRASELARELGALMVKHKCIDLARQGYTRDEINIMLDEDLVPGLNAWLAHIMQGFVHGETSAGETLN